MLQNLSQQIRDCYQHAEECRRRAIAQADPELRKDFLELERRWLKLARSYELAERLAKFPFCKCLRESFAMKIREPR
jgi:hypothetical protein